MEIEEYPLYHCRKCGYFFKDVEGRIEDPLRGQQTEVISIICEKCLLTLAGADRKKRGSS